MKTPIVSAACRLIRLSALGLAAICFAIPSARAGLTMILELSHEVAPQYFTTNYQTLLWDFEPNTNLPAAPSGNYTISSPTGALIEGFDLSSAGTSNFTGYANSSYSDYNSFINELTNGNWTITISNGTTTVYSFNISAPSFTSNTLPDLNITYPLRGSTIASNNPTFTWQGIPWGGGDIQVEDYSGATFFQENFLSTSATSWMSPSNLPAGENTFLATYSSSVLSTITATTPTNGLGQTIGSWTFESFLADYAIDVFTVSNAPPPPPTLAQALDATNLTWTTSGDANWFGETNTSYDGVSAAQSGAISGNQTSTLQTTVTGPGTLTFWWQTSSPTGYIDLEFDLDDDYVDDIGDTSSWLQEATVTIPAGTHTLTWIADGYGYATTDEAAWVDQVTYTGPGGGGSNAPVDVMVYLTIQRNNIQAGGASSYSAYAEIGSISPAPTTTDELVSPDGSITSTVNAGDTFQDYSTQGSFTSLDDAIFACTNGQWALYINEGAPNQQVFYYNMAINGLTTNLVGLATILTPAPNAVNVASNALLSWSGPTNASYLFVEAYQTTPNFVFEGYTSLASNLTSWPSPPALLTGTNIFFVEYGYFNLTNATFTVPTDTNMNPVASFGSAFYVYTDAQTQFSVRNPLAVEITNTPPVANDGNFQLGFQTIPGRTEIVQMRTNLLTGIWVDVTNFTGDGGNYQLSVPVTNSPGKYFRVITQ